MARATSRTIIRAWTKDGYHKDLAVLDSDQVRMSHTDMEAKGRHVMAGNCGAVRLVVDPAVFPEMVEFEVIVEEYARH